MEQTQLYSKEQLEKKNTSELEWYYMKAFKNEWSSNVKSTDSELETITNILFERNELREKLTIRAQIKSRLSEAIGKEEYENAALFRDMLNHYEEHIMG
ncbi:Uncharacterised protein [uncultured archaeon]|nr:Uncharacterised protein [uncultured archaeon]